MADGSFMHENEASECALNTPPNNSNTAENVST